MIQQAAATTHYLGPQVLLNKQNVKASRLQMRCHNELL